MHASRQASQAHTAHTSACAHAHKHTHVREDICARQQCWGCRCLAGPPDRPCPKEVCTLAASVLNDARVRWCVGLVGPAKPQEHTHVTGCAPKACHKVPQHRSPPQAYALACERCCTGPALALQAALACQSCCMLRRLETTSEVRAHTHTYTHARAHTQTHTYQQIAPATRHCSCCCACAPPSINPHGAAHFFYPYSLPPPCRRVPPQHHSLPTPHARTACSASWLVDLAFCRTQSAPPPPPSLAASPPLLAASCCPMAFEYSPAHRDGRAQVEPVSLRAVHLTPAGTWINRAPPSTLKTIPPSAISLPLPGWSRRVLRLVCCSHSTYPASNTLCQSLHLPGPCMLALHIWPAKPSGSCPPTLSRSPHHPLCHPCALAWPEQACLPHGLQVPHQNGAVLRHGVRALLVVAQRHLCGEAEEVAGFPCVCVRACACVCVCTCACVHVRMCVPPL